MKFIEFCLTTKGHFSEKAQCVLNVDSILAFYMRREEPIFSMEVSDNSDFSFHCIDHTEAELIYDAFKRALEGEDVYIPDIGYIRHLVFKSPEQRAKEEFEIRAMALRTEQEIKSLDQLEKEGIAKPYSRCC